MKQSANSHYVAIEITDEHWKTIVDLADEGGRSFRHQLRLLISYALRPPVARRINRAAERWVEHLSAVTEGVE